MFMFVLSFVLFMQAIIINLFEVAKRKQLTYKQKVKWQAIRIVIRSISVITLFITFFAGTYEKTGTCSVTLAVAGIGLLILDVFNLEFQ